MNFLDCRLTVKSSFFIDLAHGVEMVSKAPYRMAPAKMKELAMELQELLVKGVMRRSVSFWGALVSCVRKMEV